LCWVLIDFSFLELFLSCTWVQGLLSFGLVSILLEQDSKIRLYLFIFKFSRCFSVFSSILKLQYSFKKKVFGFHYYQIKPLTHIYIKKWNKKKIISQILNYKRLNSESKRYTLIIWYSLGFWFLDFKSWFQGYLDILRFE